MNKKFKISYQVEEEVELGDFINSVSHWLKYEVPFEVFKRYLYSHRSRLRELVLAHYVNNPTTRKNLVESRMWLKKDQNQA